MTTPLRLQDIYVSPGDYLAAERLSETKHEYLAGMIYAMSGASRDHNVIAANLLRELGTQLRGRKYQPFGSDMRVRIQRLGATFFYYPDVTVECAGSEADMIDEPTVIFEVLSPSTERGDRGDKLVNYQSLASMQVYVLVEQYREALFIYRRRSDVEWAMEFLSDPAATLELPEIDCRIPVSAIYERVIWARRPQ